jgi:hypothetical protein
MRRRLSNSMTAAFPWISVTVAPWSNLMESISDDPLVGIPITSSRRGQATGFNSSHVVPIPGVSASIFTLMSLHIDGDRSDSQFLSNSSLPPVALKNSEFEL